MDILYLMAIAQQGVTPPGGRVPFVAGWVAAAGLTSIAATFIPAAAIRAAVLGFGAAMMVAIGVPAIFSIGSPLLVCAALMGIGAIRSAEIADGQRWAMFVAPIVLLLLAGVGVAFGFALTGG